MTKGLSHILYQHSPGLIRAVAFGTDGLAWHLFHQLWNGDGENVRSGQVIEARVRAREDGGGAFLDHIGWKRSGGGLEPLYCDRKYARDVHEGQTLRVKVLSAQRRDHAAKVVPVEPSLDTSLQTHAFEDWVRRLSVSNVEEANSETAVSIDIAFDEVDLETVPLRTGGAVHIERTRALTAIDVDSSGRKGRGSAGASALSLNREAVAETARQLCLRGLGGLIAVDCVEPLNDAARGQMRETFLQTFRAHDTRDIQVLKPSKFGLLEAAVPWQDTPVSECVGTPDYQLVTELRLAQSALANDAAKFYTLGLRKSVHEAYLNRKSVVDAELRTYFHGRLAIINSGDDAEGLRRQ